MGGRLMLIGLVAALALAPAASADRWVLLEGPGRGLVLETRGSTRVVIPKEQDPLALRASGMIAEADECRGTHFHGVIGPRLDPLGHPCGWGKAARLSAATRAGQSLALDVTGERKAQALLEETDYASAGRAVAFPRYLRDARRFLAGTVRRAVAGKKLDRAAGARILKAVERKLDCALAADREAAEALGRFNRIGSPWSPKRSPTEQDVGRAKRAFAQAAACKRRVFDLLRIQHLLLA